MAYWKENMNRYREIYRREGNKAFEGVYVVLAYCENEFLETLQVTDIQK